MQAVRNNAVLQVHNMQLKRQEVLRAYSVVRKRRIKRTGRVVNMRVVVRSIMCTRRRMKVYMHAVAEKYAVMYVVMQVVRHRNAEMMVRGCAVIMK